MAKKSGRKPGKPSKEAGGQAAQAAAPAAVSARGGDGFLMKLSNTFHEVADAAPVMVARGVNRVLKFFLRGSRTEREQRALLPVVDAINALEADMVRCHDTGLRAKTDELRGRLADGESLDDVLPDAFAVAREAADRRIGMCCVLKPEHGFDPSRLKHEPHRKLLEECRARLADGGRISELMLPASFYSEIRALYPDYRPPFRMRPFDVQLIGGIVLHQGKIAEMVTGEGKTLVATLPAYLNALDGTHVHVITVNDYLARRDRDWNGPMFESLGLTVGAIQSDMNPNERKPEYACNITYGTNNEFGFDYLRDNMKDGLEDQAQGELQYAIIDEVDSILIDEARTPLIISGPAEESSDRYYVANRMVNQLAGVNAQRLPRDEFEREKVLERYDYTYNLKDHSCALTERGINSAQRFLGVDNLYHGRNMDWPPYIEAGLKAKELYKLDVDYVIHDGEVIIVDEFTGRLMPGRRWSDGLHQAVEAKEASRGARIKEENQTLATITFQNFFRLYDKIAGMTGTALTEATEFMKIYKLDVVPIPTNRPLRRAEHEDLIYGTEPEKWNAICDEIAEVHRIGRPILVGTISIEKSERLSKLLERRGIKHEVLNAKQHEREAGIVALAGHFGAVTVSTNMAGRGTDIVLGPCTWQGVFASWQEQGLAPRDLSVNLGREEVEKRLERYWLDAWGLRKEGEDGLSDEEVHRRLEAQWCERGMAPMVLANGVAELGGLHIVGTERHEARRIDNQLRGRAGRQGDPGSSRFFVSLDDDLMRVFMGEWVRKFMMRAGLSDGQPLEAGMVSRAIGRSQRKVEEQNYDIRKNLLEYDEVMDEQRKLIYDQRQEVLEGGLRRDPADVVAGSLSRYLADGLQAPSQELPERIFALLKATAGAVGVEVALDDWRQADNKTLPALLADKAAEPLRHGLDRNKIEAWAHQLLAECRADGGAYPEQWQLRRLARWADRIGLGLTGDDLVAAIRGQLAAVVAEAAREQLADTTLDELLTRWFAVGYEQDLPVVAHARRWELDTFRDWLGRLDVAVEIVQWTPATSTCGALTPLWLNAARKRFAGQPVADVAAELAACAASFYLASGIFLHRPEAERIAYWASRRLGLELKRGRIEQVCTERVPAALVATLADHVETRLRDLSAADARDLWARSAADWHLQTHLRFRDHDIIGLATYLSARLRLGLKSLDLARQPAADIADYVLGLLETQDKQDDDGEHLEGLEDIVHNMVDGSLARMVDHAVGDRAGASPGERSFAPLAEWATGLGMSITEREWQALDLHELRLHFLREAAAAHPAGKAEELVETFVPRFVTRAVGMFLHSEIFGEQPSYGGLAAWAVGRFPFLPRDTQVEAQLKRFAEDKLKTLRGQLIEAKLEEYRQSGVETDEAAQELVVATLDLFRSFGEADEIDFGGLADFARRTFDVSVQVAELEEEAEGDEREGVRVLADRAKSRYARRGIESLAANAVEGALGLCLSAERFPNEWHCDELRTWLRDAGLSQMADAEQLRDEALGDIQAYFQRAAVAAYAGRPAEVVRADLVTAALQVFLETDLAQEGRNFIALTNAAANKYGLDLEPFELSKLPYGQLEAALHDRVLEAYEARKRQLGAQPMLWTIRQLLLQTIDIKWKDHLYNMDHLRGTIGFRGYGQKDPKVEYKREGYEMFDTMTQSIEDTVTDYVLKVEFNLGEDEARHVWQADSYIHEASESFKQQQQVAEAPMGGAPAVKSIAARREPGRNDPCPCGSGKKYKKCCGRQGRAAS